MITANQSDHRLNLLRCHYQHTVVMASSTHKVVCRKIVENLEQFEAIWDTSTESYSKADIREKQYQELAKIVRIDVAALKTIYYYIKR